MGYGITCHYRALRLREWRYTRKRHRLIANQYDKDWQLVCAVIRQESGFNPRVKTRAGARGLMQLMPATAKELGVQNLYQPEQNIAGGVRYLRQQYDRFPNSPDAPRLRLALASYNAEIGRVFDAQKTARYVGSTRIGGSLYAVHWAN